MWGEPFNSRSVRAAKSRGVDIADLRARRVRSADFDEFDLILAMDRGINDFARMAPDGRRDRIKLFMDYAPDAPKREVPDPYYGEGSHFTEVLDLIEAASEGLLNSLGAGQDAMHPAIPEEFGRVVSFGGSPMAIPQSFGSSILPMAARVVAKHGKGLTLEGAMLRHLAANSRLPVPELFHADDTLLVMSWIEQDGGLTTS